MGRLNNEILAQRAKVQRRNMGLLTKGRQYDGVRSVNPRGDELQMHRSLVDSMDGPFMGVDLNSTMRSRPFD